VPWPIENVKAMSAALAPRYRIMAALGGGLGLRQGEMFGLGLDDIDFDSGEVEVCRQVKVYDDGTIVFAPPKGGKNRTVPLADVVRDALKLHLEAFPATDVTLPWGDPVADAPMVTVPLVVTSARHSAVRRRSFDLSVWRPAFRAAGIEPGRLNGCHALRHHFRQCAARQPRIDQGRQ
jgi:integrase